MRIRCFALLLLFPCMAWAQKSELSKAVDARSDAAWADARQIWEWAEAGYQEKRSAALLAD